jgi:hypothetical protein
MLGRLFDSIFVNFGLMEFFTFFSKTSFVEKVSFINFNSFYSDIFFFRQKENNSLNLSSFPLRIYSVACYLYAEENFSAIFNNINSFENHDTNSSD